MRDEHPKLVYYFVTFARYAMTHTLLRNMIAAQGLSRERCVEPKTSGRVSLKGVIPSFVTNLLYKMKKCLKYFNRKSLQKIYDK